MKKILPLLIGIYIFSGSDLIAQSNLQEFDATYVVSGLATLQHANVKIINTGSSSMDIKVSMDNLNADPNHITYFCWGIICYPPTVTVSTDPVSMAPGDTATSFIGYLNPAGYAGVSQVTYNFFDVADESDSVSVTFLYDITTGIDELSNKIDISQAYPNPANNITKISYDLKSAQNGKLVFYNLLGSVVKEINLTDSKSTLILSTNGFESGIYYYSILSNGKSSPARKLIVAHK